VIPVGSTPTPPAETSNSLEVPAQLWLWQDGQTELVGEIMDCVYTPFFWSANEKKVIIFSDTYRCDNSEATLVDLEAMSITSLFPGIKWPELSCCDPSPDGSRLIYITNDELYFLDTATFEKSKISAPPLKYIGTRWIDDQRLLVLYPNILFEPTIVGILDLETNSLEELFSDGDSFLEGENAYVLTVSPDGQWLAFATGEIFELLNAVWIVRLPDA
jgi:hypothetical protein